MGIHRFIINASFGTDSADKLSISSMFFDPNPSTRVLTKISILLNAQLILCVRATTGS